MNLESRKTGRRVSGKTLCFLPVFLLSRFLLVPASAGPVGGLSCPSAMAGGANVEMLRPGFPFLTRFTPINSMPRNPDAEIQRELSQGERLLWSGQPRQGVRLRLSDLFMIPFSLVWCSIAFFWEATAIKNGAPFFFRLWGIPFIVAGLYFVLGRFIADARARARTFYGVTTERIIIVSGHFSRQSKSLSLRTLGEISLTERSDRSGTITFGPQHPAARNFPAGWPGAAQYAAPAFEMIENAKETYELIRQTQRAMV